MSTLQISEHSSASYSPRTYHNAQSAHVTAALAVDYSTAGEKLTHKAAGQNYIALPLSADPIDSARELYRRIRAGGVQEPVINIAGNGIYTLSAHGWTQDAINLHVFIVLAKTHLHWPIGKIISGGQTGVDIAGIVAAHALGIDAVATLPKGFIQRGADKLDVSKSPGEIRAQVIAGVDLIRSALLQADAGLGQIPPIADTPADPAPEFSAEQDLEPTVEYNFGW